ncbi:MAG: copper resistance system multicopper oxidase [Woeseia sp.]
MTAPSLLHRREFLRLATASGALGLLGGLVPAWARSMGVVGVPQADDDEPLRFDLSIGAERMEIAGGTGNVQAINNSVPGPLLEWQEGRDVVINVSNTLKSDTSIHWHGIILPFEMDGVPGVTYPGIFPGTTFQYRFPVRQSGTYWYHSHSGMQEQLGVYGPLVIHPRDREVHEYDRDYVVMLSDWTFENPHHLLAKLKKHSDYYNYQQLSLAKVLNAPNEQSREELWRTKLEWDRMRMMVSDIADVTGSTYSYLMNGMHPAANWTGIFKPGERIRLRFINGSAMSIFNVRIPGLAMRVIASDGQNIEAVATDELQISTAEAYDVIVEPRDASAYTIMAESIDRSGCAAGTLATQPGMRATLPPLRTPPRLSMIDMGMDHGAMDHAAMGHGANEQGAMDHSGMNHSGMDHATMGDHGKAQHTTEAAPGTAAKDEQERHASMNHAAMNHAMHGAAAREMKNSALHQSSSAPSEPGPVVARHSADRHGVGNADIALLQRNRLGERGTGLENVAHRVLRYTDLRRLADDFDTRPPARELELHLTGHMQRYMWSFDGVQFHEVTGPIEFHHGERLRLTLVNDTMMNHPIHLHGMWLEIENGHGHKIPRKHTINVMPASRVSMLVNADAPGRWAFHCHLLYHMEMGMFRVVRVS